jgi:hypothetical protein
MGAAIAFAVSGRHNVHPTPNYTPPGSGKSTRITGMKRNKENSLSAPGAMAMQSRWHGTRRGVRNMTVTRARPGPLSPELPPPRAAKR